MSKAKRMKETEYKRFPKFLKYICILLILVIIVFFTLFYLVKTNKIAFLSPFFDNLSFNDIEFFSRENVKVLDSSKTIKGLEEIEILDVKVENISNMGFIKITLNNTSDKKISNKNIHISLLDKNDNFVYGSSLSLPNIEPNSQIDFDIVSSSEIKPFSNYFIKVE